MYLRSDSDTGSEKNPYPKRLIEVIESPTMTLRFKWLLGQFYELRLDNHIRTYIQTIGRFNDINEYCKDNK